MLVYFISAKSSRLAPNAEATNTLQAVLERAGITISVAVHTRGAGIDLNLSNKRVMLSFYTRLQKSLL